MTFRIEIEIIAVCWHAEMCGAPASFRAFSLQIACHSCGNLITVKQANSIMASSFETLNLI